MVNMTMKQAPDRSWTAEGHAGNAVVTGVSSIPSGLRKSVNGAMSPSLASTFNLKNGGGELHGESLGKHSRTVTTADGSTKGSKESKEPSSQSGRTETGNSNTFKHNSNGSAPSLQTLAMMSRLAGIPGSSLFNSSDAVAQILKNIERAGGINSGNDTHLGNYQHVEGLHGGEEGPQTARDRGRSQQNASGFTEAHDNGGNDGSDGDSERKHGGGSMEENEKDERDVAEESNRDSEDLSSGRDAEDTRKDERQSAGADGKRGVVEEEDISNPSLSEAERRKLKRRIANRESARRVRQKKQEMLEELQMKCTALTQQNARLLAAAANVETQRQDALRRTETFEHHIVSLTKENVALKSHKSILTEALKAHNISAEAILEKQATKVAEAQKRTERELQKIVNGHLPALTPALQQQQFHPMIPSNVNGMLNPTMAVSPTNAGSFQGGGNQPGMHGRMDLTASMMPGGQNANAAMLNAQVSRMMFPNSGAVSSALAMPPMPLGASPHQIFK